MKNRYQLPRFHPVACVAAGLFAICLPQIATGQEAGAAEADLGSKMQNPIGNIYSLPVEVTTDFGAANGDATFVQVQPVYPISLGDWNMVNRTIIPFIDAPGGRPGQPGNPNPESGPRASGLGDIVHSSFFSPAKAGKVIWGVGPMINIPSASKDVLGSGKWSAGPSIVLLTISKPWVVGCLIGNMWSFAGESDRANVNQFMFQYFITYNMADGWFLTTSPINTANWKASSGERWMIPIGGGIGRQFKLMGKIPSQFMIQYFHNVEKPTGAPDGSLRFTFQMAFPK